jgi:hypothetical protein
MKKTIYTLIALLLSASIFLLFGQQAVAQAPQSFKYQAIVRDGSGEIIADQPVGLQVSILQGSITGTDVYVETHAPTTNGFGLINLEIGRGTIVSGDFLSIDWGSDSYFIKIEIDVSGGTSYTEMGTTQLLSVPYALHAKTAETVSGTITETDPVFTSWDKSTGISITESQISDLGTYIETETDPVFDVSIAAGITGADTTNWNSKLDSYTETDPVFTASEAANITATDITNLSNLSGTNTGDQDLSGLATKTALGDSAARVRSEIPDVTGFLTSEADPEVGANTLNYLSKWNGNALISSSIFDNGSIGIGTTNPAVKLHIYDNDPVLAVQDLTTSTNSAEAYIKLGESSTLGDLQNHWKIGYNKSSFIFNWVDNERLRITSAGNVGIGIDSPDQKLAVAGTVESTTGGFKFPDGTVQTTAASGGGGLTLPYSGSANITGSIFNITNESSGINDFAIQGKNSFSQNVGELGGVIWGIHAKHNAQNNEVFLATNNYAISASHGTSGNNIIAGSSSCALKGQYGTSGPIGYIGRANYGVEGHGGFAGVYGSGLSFGVQGYSSSGSAVFGQSNTGLAGYFDGNVQVNNDFTLIGGLVMGNFRIDSMVIIQGQTSSSGFVDIQLPAQWTIHNTMVLNCEFYGSHYFNTALNNWERGYDNRVYVDAECVAGLPPLPDFYKKTYALVHLGGDLHVLRVFVYDTGVCDDPPEFSQAQFRALLVKFTVL